MIYKTYLSDSKYLLSIPETGMGYQIIEGQLTGSYVKKRYIVYNCDLIVDLDTDFHIYKKQIINRGYASILNESAKLNLKADSIRLVQRNYQNENKYVTESIELYNKRHSGRKGALENQKEYANGNEIFVRISAYEDDKRIDFLKKKILNGTYTTTHNDYLDCINTVDNPIDRYALPNDENIKWAFYIQPKSVDLLQRGIVQPAFGHQGGGIEAYFENGTSENTLITKREYGK